MSFSFNQRISIPNNVLVRELGGESVLLNVNSESYFGLDEIGTQMWTALSNSTSIEIAYEMLLAEYEVEPERLRQDLQNLIEKLMEHGLLEAHNAEVA